MLVTPAVKVATMVSLVAPLGFLALASPLLVAAMPMLLERMLATGYPSWWTASYHYDAYLVMVLMLAAVDGAARMQRRVERRWPRLRLPLPARRTAAAGAGAAATGAAPHMPSSAVPEAGQAGPVADTGGQSASPAGRLRAPGARLATVWAAAVCAAAIVALPASPIGQVLHPSFYTVNARIRAAAVAVGMVPDGALVEASDYVGPRLSGRAQVLLFDGTPRWAPWVVADTAGLDFPFCSPADAARQVTTLEAAGYTRVFARDGYVVLRRPADARTQAALRHPAKAALLRGNACPRYR
jgi:hypothetical protein